MIQGSSCPAYQTTSRVQRRWAVDPAEGSAEPDPGRVGKGDEGPGRQASAAVSTEGDVLTVAHTGMPALGAYLPRQLGAGYAPVAEHDDGHVPGNRRGQFLEQFHGGVHPGALLGGLVDTPGHGNGAAPVDHADDDGSDLVPFQRGVDGQGQAAGDPPREDPFQQGREAESNVQFGLAGTGPVAAVVEPLPEVLAQAVPVALGGEGRGHGVLAGAASKNCAADPQDQAGQLWPGEVR